MFGWVWGQFTYAFAPIAGKVMGALLFGLENKAATLSTASSLPNSQTDIPRTKRRRGPPRAETMYRSHVGVELKMHSTNHGCNFFA
jgi:hypothetical protein